MHVLLLHTLKSIGKRPLQTVIVIVAVAIVAACFVMVLSMDGLFFSSAMLWAGRTHGDADFSYEAAIPELAKNAELVRELADQRLGADVVFHSGGSYRGADTANGKISCLRIWTPDLDEFEKLMGTEIAERLDEAESGGEYFEAHVAGFFLELSGMKLGDIITVEGLNKPVRITAVAADNSIYFSHPQPVIVVQKPIEEHDDVLSMALKTDASEEEVSAFIEGLTELFPESGFRGGCVRDYAVTTARDSANANSAPVYAACFLIIVLMAALLFLSSSVIARARSEELVRFKAAGATPAQCVLILLGESVIYAVLGALPGLGLGAGLMQILINSFRVKNALDFAVAGSTYAIAFFASAAVGIAAAAAAAAKVSVLPAARLLASRDAVVRRPSLIAIAATAAATIGSGVGMTLASGTAVYVLLSLFMVAACALVALLLPLMTRGMCALYAKIRGTAPGYIAARSSVNSPACSRTATALALLICFMFVAMSLVDSVKALSSSSYGRFAADYIATLPTDAPLSREDATELKNELAALEETSEVIIATSLTNYYPIGPTNDLQTLTVIGLLEGKALYRFCRGIDEETVRRFDKTEYPVVINYQLALAMGLSVGDALPVDGTEVSLPEGADLTVVGIDTTVSSFDSYCYSVYGICSRNNTQLYLDSGDPTRAREILEACGFDFYEGKNYYIDSSTFSIVDMLSSFSTIVYAAAAMGMLNMIAISASDRRREIGIFRLVGFTTGDIVRFHVTEACQIMLLGGVSGAVIGGAATAVFLPLSRTIGKYIAGYISALPLLYITLGASAAVGAVWLAAHLTAALPGKRGKNSAARDITRNAG